MKCFLILASALLLSAGCHQDDRSGPPPSAGVEILSQYDIPLPEVQWAFGVAATDDGRLFVLDSYGPEYLYQVDLNRRTVVGKFGRAGDGPGELGDPASLQFVGGQNPHLWVMQANRRLITRYDITAEPVFRESIRFESRIPLFNALMLPSGMIASGAFRSSGALIRGDSTFHSQRPWGQAPYRPEDLPQVLVFDANWAAVATNPAGTRIAAAFRYAPEIQVMDTTGTVLRRILPPNGVGHPDVLIPRQPVNFDPDSSDISYLAVAASDSAIIAIYCGCHGFVRRSETGPAQIQVYRWDGTLVGKQAIARRITAAAVSRDGRTLYLATIYPEPSIAVLHLKY